MKSRKSSNMLKIVSATAVAIFSLLSVFMGTIAWFSANQLLSSSNMNAGLVQPTGMFKKLSFHRLVSNAYDDTLYNFDQVPIGSIELKNWIERTTEYVPNTDDEVELDEYTILEHRHPMLMLIELQGEYDIAANFINVQGLTETIGFVGDRDSGLELQQNGNPLSSIIHFAAFGYTKAALNATKTTYTVQEETKNVYAFAKPVESDFRSFVNFQVTGEENVITGIDFDKTISIYSSSEDTNKNIKTNTETETKVQYIPIIMDYYDTALEFIYSTYLGEDVLDEDIEYQWDWEMRV